MSNAAETSLGISRPEQGFEWTLPVIATVFVASLGYFVDVYDLIIFSVVRKDSLSDLHIAGADSLKVGLMLLNVQLLGVMIGGILWGVLGDRRGRLWVLFGSIVIYSVANIANAFVYTQEAYLVCRFCAGFGLAGELGAAVTLVTEILNKGGKRGYGTMCIAGIGLLGAVFASYMGRRMGWRNIFLTGGCMGLILLVLRLGIHESKLYLEVRSSKTRRGDIRLFFEPDRALRYLRCILVDTHMYFVVGILLTGSPELGNALGVHPLPTAGVTIGAAYGAMAVADFVSSMLSQWWKSRRAALAVFHCLALVAILVFLYVPAHSYDGFIAKAMFLGFSVGSWAVVNVVVAEKFGTNIRALAAITVPNLIRGLLLPISYVFGLLVPVAGLINAAALVGVVCVLISLGSLWTLKETYHKDMDWIEVATPRK